MADITIIQRKPFLYCLIAIILLLFSLLSYLFISRPRIAYVRTLELVYGYNGMKEAHSTFKNQTQSLQSNLDSLRIEYQRAVADYKNSEENLSSEDKKQRQRTILALEDNVNKYAKAASKRAQDSEKELTESILNQVNSFVQEYAKKKGYDLVLGAGGNGSVMFGASSYDITEEVLDAINSDYKILPEKK